MSASLLLNSIILLSYLNSPFSKIPVWDAKMYWDKARAIAGGNLLGDAVFHQAPLYQYFLAPVIMVFGESLTAVYVIQALVSALSCGLLYSIIKRVAGKRDAVIAACIFALYGMQVFYTFKILSETVSIFLMLASFYFFVNFHKRGFLPLAGVFIGLLCLSKPHFLFLVPFAGLFLFSRVPRQRFGNSRKRNPALFLPRVSSLPWASPL